MLTLIRGARFVLLVLALVTPGWADSAQKEGEDAEPRTTFAFGGYAKLDVLASKYYDGLPAADGAIRDIHFPAAIPVGGESDVFGQLDLHAKESRFHFKTLTEFANGKTVAVLVELDFLLGGQGDERVSNSFNPRLRHFYFEYDEWTLGQTWSVFQILDVPEDLDFAGVADGFIFNRQPQIRFSSGSWELSLENPETTLNPFRGGDRVVTEGATLPDFVVRHNSIGDWGNFSIAGLLRRLNHQFERDGVVEETFATGYGITIGGRIKVGKRDDIVVQASDGEGLGRYAAFNFANGAVLDARQNVQPTPSYLGFLGYRHFWNENLRTNVNVSGIMVDYDREISGESVNESAYSFSANLLYSPLPKLTFGVELMRGTRELEGGTKGKFDRLQLSGRYDFSFSSRD